MIPTHYVIHKAPEELENLYKVVDEIIEYYIGEDIILPDYSLEEIMEQGLEKVRPHGKTLLSDKQVADRVRDALDNGDPLSLIRLRCGEALALSCGVKYTPEEIVERARWMRYALGEKDPSEEYVSLMIEGINKADIIGVATERIEYFQPLLFECFNLHGIDWRRMDLTRGIINYSMHQRGYIQPVIEGKKVILIGNKSPQWAQKMRKERVNIVETIFPVNGFEDIDDVVSKTQNIDFDVALVACGVAAVALCPRVAEATGKVVIDMGHVADEVAIGYRDWWVPNAIEMRLKEYQGG